MKGKKQAALFMAAVLCVTSFSTSVAANTKTETENSLENKTEAEKKEAASSNKEADETKKEAHSKTKDQADKEKKTSIKTGTEQKQEKESKKKTDTGLKNEKEEEVKKEEVITLTAIEDFQKIGTEGYPLDGSYVLANDINGKIEETKENTVIEPLISGEKVFTGKIDGNGFAIANFTVQRTEEGGQNTAIFGGFGGSLENIKFINITVKSEKNSGAILAENLTNAKLKEVFLAGNVVLSNKEEQPEEPLKQRKEGTLSLYIDGQTWEEKAESLKQKGEQRLENQTIFQDVKVMNSCSDLSENIPDGIQKITTNPDYISGIEGKAETIKAPELEGFTFRGFTMKNVKNEEDAADDIKSPDKPETKVDGKEGKYELKASYEYTLTGGQDVKNQTAEVSITVQCVFGKDIQTIEKLKPIDNVFPKQISVVMKLVAIDGVFPSYLSVGKKTEGETIKITTWEQFKNIGNTQYDETFVMNGNYILEANIYSDGKTFVPIGTKENPFTGSFDGNGFEINVSSNPEINTDSPYNGLFGVVQSQE